MGSNPIPVILSLRSTILVVRRTVYPEVAGSCPVGVVFGGVAQLGERLPCKQKVRSSILLASTHAGMAQLAERLICNQQVSGSSPDAGLSGVIPRYQCTYIKKKEKEMRKTKRKQKVRKQYPLRQ